MNVTLLYLIFNWLIILLSIAITVFDSRFYLITFFIIASRQFAIYLVGHEGVHNLISNKKSRNDFIAKYFCLFPVMVSLEMYRQNHLAHHKFLGTVIDPDKSLYNFYPLSKNDFFSKLAKDFFTFKMLADFLAYFTPFYLVYRSKRISKILEEDFLPYTFFIIITWSLFFKLGWGWYFLKFWIFPLVLMIPYYYFVSALQHGLIFEKDFPSNSRNIISNDLIIEFFLPCRTNYHAAHHEHPGVPFYKLEKYLNHNQLNTHGMLNAIKQLVKE